MYLETVPQMVLTHNNVRWAPCSGQITWGLRARRKSVLWRAYTKLPTGNHAFKIAVTHRQTYTTQRAWGRLEELHVDTTPILAK